MHNEKDKRRESSADHSRTSASQTDDASAEKNSGRVAFDSRGNSVWEWKTEEDGKFSRDVNTQYIKQLEAPELSLEESGVRGVIERPETRDEPKKIGFNPYDRGALGNAANQSASADTPARKPIKDLRRYNEWLKLKQRLAENKDDE